MTPGTLLLRPVSCVLFLPAACRQKRPDVDGEALTRVVPGSFTLRAELTHADAQRRRPVRESAM
jgi:hypothetical protein